VAGIVTTYFRIANDKTLGETLDRCLGGFDELQRKEEDTKIFAEYFATLNNSSMYNYLVLVLNNMGIYEIAQMDSDTLVDGVIVRITGAYTHGTSGEKLFIVSIFDAYEEVELRPKVEQIQSLSNFFNINDEVDTWTDSYNWSPDMNLPGDVVFTVATKPELNLQLEDLKNAITQSWKKICERYNIDWRFYMLASSADYSHNQHWDYGHNPETLHDVLTHYNSNDTPGIDSNTLTNALWGINNDRIMKRDDRPMHVVSFTDAKEYPDVYSELWTSSYSLGDETDADGNRDFDKLTDSKTWFEQEGITVSTIAPLDIKEYNMAYKTVIDTGGFWADMDNFGGSYVTLLETIAKDIAGRGTNMQLTKGSIIPASIRVTDRFGYEYPTTCWEYNHERNSLIFLPLQEGSPVQLTNVKVTYDYVPATVI
jgi:hypothetical protein